MNSERGWIGETLGESGLIEKEELKSRLISRNYYDLKIRLNPPIKLRLSILFPFFKQWLLKIFIIYAQINQL